MNYGPLIFLGAFFALATSWFGLVLTPQMQLGQMQPTNTVPLGTSYPTARAGLARQGLDVYRANGCAYCHSQQVRQSGTLCDVVLSDAGTNQPALTSALKNLRLEADLRALPKTLLKGVTKQQAEAAITEIKAASGKAELWIVPIGPDIAQGWGKRRSVADDFLFDSPVMPGSQRVGPDLANVGMRQPDPNWHLRHLYEPSLVVTNSKMPPYRFLFELRKIQRAPSTEALALIGTKGAPPGYEIIPSEKAFALAAYLVSLRADAPLYVAPLTVPAPVTPATNAPATNTPVAMTNTK